MAGTAQSKLAKRIELAAKAGAGVVLAVLAAWAIGRFNNGLAISIHAERTPASKGNDVIVLKLNLKKVGPTRMRLDECVVEISSADATPLEAGQLAAVSKTVAAELTRDLRVTERGIALAPEDEVEYEAYFRAGANLPLHIKVLINATMYVMEWIPSGGPRWSSSVVVPPAPSTGSATETHVY